MGNTGRGRTWPLYSLPYVLQMRLGLVPLCTTEAAFYERHLKASCLWVSTSALFHCSHIHDDTKQSRWPEDRGRSLLYTHAWSETYVKKRGEFSVLPGDVRGSRLDKRFSAPSVVQCGEEVISLETYGKPFLTIKEWKIWNSSYYLYSI